MFSISHERVLQRGFLRIWLAAPIIYAMVIPIAFLDVCVSFYQWVCFWAYGLPRIERKTYVRLLWRGTGMIKGLDRFNCMYCGYANGVLAYVRAIAIETEKYWCPIKYKARKDFKPPHSQDGFADPENPDAVRGLIQET